MQLSQFTLFKSNSMRDIHGRILYRRVEISIKHKKMPVFNEHKRDYSIMWAEISKITKLGKFALFIVLFGCIEGGIPKAQAEVFGAPVLEAPCPLGSINTKNEGLYCWITWDGSVNGNALFGGGGQFRAGRGITLNAELKASYAPFTGKFAFRAYLCPSSTTSKCSVAKATDYISSTSSVLLNSTQSVSAQKPNFNGNSSSKVMPYSFNMCYVLVDEDGRLWTSREGVMCSPGGTGAHELPSTPAACYLNYGEALDVAMGTLERSKIATVPAYGSTGNVKKSFSVVCSGDAGVSVLTSFLFTPITFNGKQVVSTSSAHLGVAVFYKGALIRPSNQFYLPEHFVTGYTERELEFQALRDPNVALKEIPTGDFNASMIMVMTEQ